MPPRKRARGGTQTANATNKNGDAMDIDTPQGGSEAATSPDPEVQKLNEYWTDDQIASLFKGVIRWKPAGMHKHFRMIAISEHLRNHGFDPDYYKHTRIPYIWQKLRTFYNLEAIDDRENPDDDEPEDRYLDFALPKVDFYDMMMQRALADPSSTPSSPGELDLEAGPSSSPPKKRKRASTVSRTRGTSREDTEEATDAQSPAGRSTRGSRGRTRAASAAKAEKADTTEEEEVEDEEGSEQESETGGEEEDEEAEGSGEDNAAQSTKSTRGSTRTRGRAAPTRTSRRRGK